MADALTGSNYYKHSLTEYEVEAYERDALADQTNRRAALDAEIVALEAEIAAAKIKRNIKLAAMDALEAEIVAAKIKRT